jgi:hypothetical protein
MKTSIFLPAVAFGAYKKFDRAGLTWPESQRECEKIGTNLVSFDSEAEFTDFSAWLGESTEGYWIGYRDDHGDVVNVYGSPAGYTNFKEGEPNNKMGAENCIR